MSAGLAAPYFKVVETRLPWDPSLAGEIIAAHAGLEGPLLPVLHAVQDAFGCVPREAVPLIAKVLNLSRAEVHGVVTFYHDFRAEPAAPTVVKVCRAEACQSMGGLAVGDTLLSALGIAPDAEQWGGTSADGSVTVQGVCCLGLCAVAPAALIDGAPAGRLDARTLIGRVKP